MKHNRIASAVAEYNRKFTNNKHGKGAFYASDFYEIKELAEKSGGVRQHPLHGNRPSYNGGLYDRVQISKEGSKEKVAGLIAALLPDQRERLNGFLELLLAWKDGKATERSVASFICNLPQGDIKPFTEILEAIRQK